MYTLIEGLLREFGEKHGGFDQIADKRRPPLIIENARTQLSDKTFGGERKFRTGYDTVVAYVLDQGEKVMIAKLEQTETGWDMFSLFTENINRYFKKRKLIA